MKNRYCFVLVLVALIGRSSWASTPDSTLTCKMGINFLNDISTGPMGGGAAFGAELEATRKWYGASVNYLRYARTYSFPVFGTSLEVPHFSSAHIFGFSLLVTPVKEGAFKISFQAGLAADLTKTYLPLQ